MPLSNFGDDFDKDEPSPIQEHMTRIGKMGGETTLSRKGYAFFRGIGSKGGSSTKEKHGPDYYKYIGRLGGLEKARKRAEMEKAKREWEEIAAFAADVRARDEDTGST